MKNGSYKGIQRYRCLDCGRCFSEIPPKFSFQTKLAAVKMYLRNGSMRAVAEAFGVSASTILRWLRSFHRQFKGQLQRFREQLSCDQEPDVVELDEIYTYCQKNAKGSSFGLLILEGKAVLLAV